MCVCQCVGVVGDLRGGGGGRGGCLICYIIRTSENTEYYLPLNFSQTLLDCFACLVFVEFPVKYSGKVARRWLRFLLLSHI